MERYKSIFQEKSQRAQLKEVTKRKYKKSKFFPNGDSVGEFAFSAYGIGDLRDSILNLEKLLSNAEQTKEFVQNAIFSYNNYTTRDDYYVTKVEETPMISFCDGNIYVNFEKVSLIQKGTEETWVNVTIRSVIGGISDKSWKLDYANGDDYS